ncbi:Pentatricopeptide repeat-containing protein [Glycine soja]
MKSRWKFNAHLPSWMDSLNIPSIMKNPPTSQNPFPATSKSALNHADLSSLLSVCGRDGNLNLGSSIHARIIKQPPSFDFDSSPRNALFVWNSLLSMYSKCGQLQDAIKLLDHMPVKDTVSWNAIVSGFLRNKDFDTGFRFFREMSESRTVCCRFDKATLTTMLSAGDGLEFSSVTKMIPWFCREITVGNALITSYFKCGCLSQGRQVFDEMLERNVVTSTAVISGLAQNEFYEDGFDGK